MQQVGLAAGRAHITRDAVLQGIASFVERGEVHLRYLDDRLAPDERALVRVLNSEPDREMSPAEAATLLAHQGDAVVPETLAGLQRAGVVESRCCCCYRLRVGLFSAWLRRQTKRREPDAVTVG